MHPRLRVMGVRSSAIDEASAVAIIERGGPSQTQRIPSQAGAQPVIANLVSCIETMLVAVRRTNVPTATIGGGVVFVITDSTGRIVRGGSLDGALEFSRVDGVAVTKLGFVKPSYSAPAGAPYTAESVTVPAALGHSLGGTFTKPTGVTTALPVVISISGSGPQDRDGYISIVRNGYRLFRQVADTLGRRGVAMLRMDDRGVGESGGSFATATIRDFADDIRAAVTWLRSRSDVDPRRIFLIGHSKGGMISPMPVRRRYSGRPSAPAGIAT